MDATTVFLGAIALATLVMATVQVGMIIYGAKLARRVDRLVDVVETELRPTLGRVNSMSDDMSRATSLVAAQAERADQLFERVAGRVDRLSLLTEDAVVEPMRQGAALLQGLRVALAVLRGGESGQSGGPAASEPAGEEEGEKALSVG